MYRRKIVTCITVILMAAALVGVFCYASYVKDHKIKKEGTFVSAFAQKVNEYSL